MFCLLMFFLVLVLVVSPVLLVSAALKSSNAFAKTPRTYERERLEKTCDAVISLLAIVIAGSLLVISWVFDKVHLPGYRPWLALALALGMLWFIVVLFFTLYMRFNFVWRVEGNKFTVGGDQRENSKVLWWLDTIMVGMTAGLFCLSVPILLIALKMPKPPPISPPVVQVECHVDAPNPAPTQVKPIQSGKSQLNQKKH